VDPIDVTERLAFLGSHSEILRNSESLGHYLTLTFTIEPDLG